MLEMLEILTDAAAATMAPSAAKRRPAAARRSVLADWLKLQPVSVARHAAGLRPFTREEFGDTAAAPTEGHIQAANALITRLRDGLLRMAARVTSASAAARQQASHEALTRFVIIKDQA